MEARFVDSIWITAMPGFERGGRERDEGCPGTTAGLYDRYGVCDRYGERHAFVPLTAAELDFYRNWGRRRLRERGEEEHVRFADGSAVG